jgi:hypothetical protein
MRRGGPEGQVAEDLLDHRGLFDEGDDAHPSGTAGTHERIDFIDLLDEACPGALRGSARDFGELWGRKRVWQNGQRRRRDRRGAPGIDHLQSRGDTLPDVRDQWSSIGNIRRSRSLRR